MAMKAAVLSLLALIANAAVLQYKLHPITLKLNDLAELDTDATLSGSTDTQQGYTIVVHIGTPPVKFNLLVSNMQPRFWVVDSICQSDFCHGKQSYYRPNSTTGEDVDEPWIISYKLYFAALGRSAKDIILFGKDSAYPLVIENATFNLAESVFWLGTRETRVDGVLGLSSTNYMQLPSNPIKEAISRGIIDPVITLAFPSLETGKEARVTFGGRDREACDMDRETVEDVITDERWMFRYESVQIGDIKYDATENDLAYPHSSRHTLALPPMLLKAVASAFGAEFDATRRMYIVECKQYDSFVLKTAQNVYEVPSDRFVTPMRGGSEKCMLMLEESKAGGVILGLPFENQFCQILYPSVQKIGFAPVI